MLLGLNLGVSAMVAALAAAMSWPAPGMLLTLAGYFGLLFAINRFRDSAAGVVLAISGWATVTRRDLSGMGSFLFIGMIVAMLAGLGAMFFQIPALSLTVSAAVVLLMAGMIAFEIQRIVRGGETNYVMAATGLFVSIFNLFTALLQLFGFMGSDE